MAIKLFRGQAFATDDPNLTRQLNEVVGAVKDFVRPLEGNSSLDNVHLKDVVLASLANTVVPHKLGRVPQEWWITRQNGPSGIYEVARSATTLTLYSSGTVTVDLRVS